MPFTFVASLRRLREKVRKHPSGEVLVQYADGELPPEMRRDVEHHLHQCEECRISTDEFGDVLRGAAGGGKAVSQDIMDEMLRGILSTIGASPRRTPGWTADGLRDLALCLGTDEAVATRRRDSPAVAVPRLAALLGTPAASALVRRNDPST